LPETTELHPPVALHALGKQEHFGTPLHEGGIAMQNGGGGTQGLGWQPGPETPAQDGTSVVPAGHAPPSGRAVHAGKLPPQHGSTHTMPAPQVCVPHAVGPCASAAPVSGGSPPEPSTRQA
jgi:hypothetical protein